MMSLLKTFTAATICLFGALSAFPQTEESYAWPIDSPRTISGNYGELRPNHFHAGIDFSTKGKINYPVYSIAEGYISRIRVSAGGYGKNVYVTHKDGRVSVYCHLNSFNTGIAALVKKEQYAKQSYEVEIIPVPGQYKVKKHEYVGFSGNTGASTGPHLHFEIRDGQTETPLNPLQYYPIDDHTPPVIERVAFYNLADTSAPKFLGAYRIKKNKKDSLVPEKDSIILNQGILGIAFSGYDQFEPKGSQNNIFFAKVWFDDKLIYGHTLDLIDFSDQRFVNEFSETVEKFRYQKCFIPTLYPPNLYDKRHTKGRILLTDTNFHTITLLVHDENANERTLRFSFKSRKLNFYAPPSIQSDVFVNCTRDFMISKNKLQIYIPANTLYYSTALIFENTIESTGKIIILPTQANLRSTSIIGFEVPPKYLANKTKLVLKSGSSVLTPIIKRDSVFYSVKNFGWFVIDQDTIPPKIKTQLSTAQLKKMKNLKSFSFAISDNLSGISKYNLYVGDKWVIGEYDAKSDLLSYNFDEDTPPGPLIFRLEAEDRVGNRSVFEYTLKR
jgi:hypothetical protein